MTMVLAVTMIIYNGVHYVIKASKGENLSEDDAYTILLDMKKTLHNEKLVDSLKNQLESYADLGDKLFNEKQLDDELKDNH